MRSDGVRTAVNQAPGGSDYPFASDTPYSQLLTDLYLSYEDETCAFAYPFEVRWLYGFGVGASSPPGGLVPTHTRDIIIVDVNSDVVFDSTLADYREQPWGTRVVCEWRTDSAVLRVVVRTEDAADYLTNEEPSEVLDPRTHNRLPNRVRSLRVGSHIFTGPVTFESEYNMAITVPEPTRVDGGRFQNLINMDASPGGGIGQSPGCIEVVPYIRRINQILPSTSGNFVIEADDCFRATRPLVVASEFPRTAFYRATGLTDLEAGSALRLSSDCQPCCPCDYFVRTYNGIRRLWDTWQEIAQDAETARDTYTANRLRWLEQRDCRQENVGQLVLYGYKNCRIFAGGSLCNFSACCLVPVEIRFTVQRYAGAALVDIGEIGVVEGELEASATDGAERYVPLVTGPVIQFIAEYANAQATTIARMRLCAVCEEGESLRITMTAHAPDPAPTEEGVVCELPTVEVGPDILAIWAANGISAEPAVRAVVTRSVPLNPAPVTFDCTC